MHRFDPWALLRYVFCRMFCGHPSPKQGPHVRVRIECARLVVTFTGDFLMKLPDDKTVSASVSYADAKGNPATVDGAPVWSTDRPDLVTLDVAADGMSATVTPVGPLGSAQIVIDADADLGAGVVPLQALGTVEVIGGQAVAGVVNFGEPA